MSGMFFLKAMAEKNGPQLAHLGLSLQDSVSKNGMTFGLKPEEINAFQGQVTGLLNGIDNAVQNGNREDFEKGFKDLKNIFDDFSKAIEGKPGANIVEGGIKDELDSLEKSCEKELNKVMEIGHQGPGEEHEHAPAHTHTPLPNKPPGPGGMPH